MKQHVKLYEEYSQSDSQFFQTKEDIVNHFGAIRPDKYKINDDLTVDIFGDFSLGSKSIKNGESIIKYGKVTGNFNCIRVGMTSLKGCPYWVGGTFNCCGNQLTSLEGCPQNVGGSFVCYENNLTSLVFAPKVPSSYGFNPCAKFYNISGFNTQSHIKALLECDPNPADTIQRLKKYNPSLAKELSLEFGLEDEELTTVYNKVKNIEGGYF